MDTTMIIFILAAIGIPFLSALFIHYATKYTINRLKNLK